MASPELDDDAPKLIPSALGQRAGERCRDTEAALRRQSRALTRGDEAVLDSEQLWRALRNVGYRLRPLTAEVRENPAQVMVVLADALAGFVAAGDPKAVEVVTECEQALGLPKDHVKDAFAAARGGGRRSSAAAYDVVSTLARQVLGGGASSTSAVNKPAAPAAKTGRRSSKPAPATRS